MDIRFSGLTLIDTHSARKTAAEAMLAASQHTVSLTALDHDMGLVIWGQDAVDLLDRVGVPVSLEAPKEENDRRIEAGFVEKFGPAAETKRHDLVWSYGSFLKDLESTEIRTIQDHTGRSWWA